MGGVLDEGWTPPGDEYLAALLREPAVRVYAALDDDDADDRVVSALALDVLGGQVPLIRSVANPDELAHLGPVGDAVATLRQTRDARRGHRS